MWQYMPTRTTSCISCAMRSASVFLLAWAHVIRQGSAPCSALRTRTSCLALYCLCCLKARRASTASTRSSRPCLVETAEFVGNPAAYFAPCVPSTFDSIRSTNRRAIWFSEPGPTTPPRWTLQPIMKTASGLWSKSQKIMLICLSKPIFFRFVPEMMGPFHVHYLFSIIYL